MTSDEAIQRFGIPSDNRFRDDVRKLLEVEIGHEMNEEVEETELLLTLCVQLFSMGVAEDSLLIWKAKTCNFDTQCGLDVQLLCGAGLEATKEYLRSSKDLEAKNALKYLQECVETGDFQDWTPLKWVENYRKYFHL